MFQKSQEIIGAVILLEDITQAKQLQRARDEFFAIASHELRTPLTAIRGNTALVKQYFTDQLKDHPELEEMITDTHSSSIRLIDIVNPNAKTIDSLQRIELPAGVDIEIKIQQA